MKINEVEKIIGITKKNIRFYEKEGLLSPCRNKENGYREYNEDDIKKLEEIKLLRKLGVPIEDIRSLQNGRCTVSDAMRRHLITLERAKQNIDHSINFCNSLKSEDKMLSDLDVHELLSHMESMESTGASFNNIHSRDVKPGRYIGSVIASVVMISLMIALDFIFIVAFKYETPAPPLILRIIILAAPIAIIIGIIFSLIQRILEIGKGEADDAKRF
mgnify:CR=1 FL=1